MHLYTASDIKAWETYTLLQQNITEDNLIERAATVATQWLLNHFDSQKKYVCCCGNGNNGADGLAIARMLHSAGISVKVIQMPDSALCLGAQNQQNLLTTANIQMAFFGTTAANLYFSEASIIVDALLGTGLNRPVSGQMKAIVEKINDSNATIISIDVPSGVNADGGNIDGKAVKSKHTITFQVPKLSAFWAESAVFWGKWHIIDIGLDSTFHDHCKTSFHWVDTKLLQTLNIPPLQQHTHKGLQGHAVLFAGSAGMMGAGVLAVKGCLRSGTGLVTICTQKASWPIVQTSVPSAMCAEPSQVLQDKWYLKKTAVAAGLGWIADDEHANFLKWLMHNVKPPLVIDATAITLIAAKIEWFQQRPQDAITIITPHIGEFHQLFGTTQNSKHRLALGIAMAEKHNVFMLLKGAYTQVITPKGNVFFNSTGNPGMAKGGAGDVLTGLLTGLLAQGISPEKACIWAAYIHGLAGDKAAKDFGKRGMMSADIADYLGDVWLEMEENESNFD